ncbi:MAG TPA: glycoside hydrolase family 3 N-terminal domain-containing protein [Patescibacteria group bacterium]|nr:glycoside hydrolase family 3 N-terminal domain-containing protein [Patescibacteria group bacterium]
MPPWVRRRLAEAPAAGVTLFRHANVASPAQVRALTAALQAAAGGGAGERLPLLVAADQEGGQLIALGDGTTPFAGNMALGAAGDAGLAERVGEAIGREMRALGVNVLYAPVLDVATSRASPALGIRSFGDDPAAVAVLGAAFVRGVARPGVASTGKHFPGAGDVATDTHHALGVVDHDRARLAAVELVPFRAAIDAGLRLVMTGHFVIPSLTGSPTLPSTLSSAVVDGLLRGELGFDGVSITDALDMRALDQGPAQVVDVIAAIRADVDLLLCAPDLPAQRRIEKGLRHAAGRALFDRDALEASARRVAGLRRWLAGFPQPDLGVVGCAEHHALAGELAARSVTLVRDDPGLVPLQLAAGARVAAIMPTPRDLTPADTSSTVLPGLGAALRRHHPHVDEIVTGHPPDGAEIAAIRGRAASWDVIVVGTLDAHRDAAQGALVEALRASGRPLVTVALRTPYDLAAYPAASTHLCTYSILRPSLDALADVLFGVAPARGRLPVAIPGVLPRGHGLGAITGSAP